MKAARALFAEFRTGQGLKGQLLRGGVGSVAVKIGSTLLSVALAVVLARALGAEGFGIYSFVFALITILAIPAQMGLPNLVVRETAKAQAANDWPLINGLWRWATLMALMMSAALIIIGALAAWIFAARLPDGGLAVFYWGLVLVPLIALGNLRGAALRGLRHVVQGQLPERILRPGLLIIFIGLAWLMFNRHLDATGAMALHVLASLAAFIIGAFLLMRARPSEVTTPAPTYEHRAWLAAALPLAMIVGMNEIINKIDLVMLGMFTTSEEVGAYRVAVSGAMLVTFGLQAANIVIAPHFARFHAQIDKARMQLLASKSAAVAVMISTVPFVAFLFAGETIIFHVFGPEYTPAALPLAILAVGQFINAFAASAPTILSMTGHERYTVRVLIGTVLMTIVLNLALIPPFGLVGAAAGTSIAIAFRSLCLWAITLNRLGIDSSLLAVLRSPASK